MPRPLRLHVPGAFHYVTLRGNHQSTPQNHAGPCMGRSPRRSRDALLRSPKSHAPSSATKRACVKAFSITSSARALPTPSHPEYLRTLGLELTRV
jgi:hypothetical protein